jgi:nucleoside-diphosphate-sugar epimerase
MKALVTGGSGYFGQLLVEEALRAGHSVRIFDIARPDETDAPVEIVQGDIRDKNRLREACAGIDVVFHNVAQVPLAKNRGAFWSVNRDGTRNLLEACEAEKVRKVVYTSTSAVFGVPRINPVTEATEPHPMEEYGRAKLEGEHLCTEFSARGLDTSIIRPRTIMGHGRLGIFQILFEWIYEGRNIPVLSGGANRYQFVHANDLAAACLLAGMRPGPAVYNCGTDRFGSMRDVLEHVCAHAGTGSKVVSVPMRLAETAMNLTSWLGLSPLGPYHSLMYGRSMYFDIAKAKEELGWAPRYSNNEMFVESYDWYCRHRQEVLAGRNGASPHRSQVKQRILTALKYFL